MTQQGITELVVEQDTLATKRTIGQLLRARFHLPESKSAIVYRSLPRRLKPV
jgi:hypothetical protein